MLKINSTSSLEQVIIRYHIWCDHKRFYEKSRTPVISSSPDGIPCYMYYDIAQINKHQNSLIAIDCLTEGIHSIEFFNQYDKSNQYLIFSNGNWDTSYHPININYKLVHHLFFLFEMADTYNTPNKFCYYIDKTYQFDTPKPYIFVSTVGNVRKERTYLVDQLSEKISYKNYLLRYSGVDINGCGDKDVIQVVPGHFDPYITILEKYFYNVSQTIPINLFNEGRVNLIVESDINWTHEFFLTEKTIKNLIIGMPFIIVGTPYFLENLKKLGFKTYAGLWDESYDTIENHEQRIDKIIELCNSLSSFDWQANMDELIYIGQQNRLNFLQLNKVADEEFIRLENIIKDL